MRGAIEKAGPQGTPTVPPPYEKIDNVANLDLVELIEEVILPTIIQNKAVGGKNVQAMIKAMEDLNRMAKNLRRDALTAPQMTRVFEEVRVTRRELDQSLGPFRNDLWREVRSGQGSRSGTHPLAQISRLAVRLLDDFPGNAVGGHRHSRDQLKMPVRQIRLPRRRPAPAKSI